MNLIRTKYIYHEAPFEFRGYKYVSAEDAFQTAKFLYSCENPTTTQLMFADVIRGAENPRVATFLGTMSTDTSELWMKPWAHVVRLYVERGLTFDANAWNQMSDAVMYDILICKFDANPDALDQLMNASDEVWTQIANDPCTSKEYDEVALLLKAQAHYRRREQELRDLYEETGIVV